MTQPPPGQRRLHAVEPAAPRPGSPRPAQARLEPLDPPMLPFVLAGVGLWLVAWLVLLVIRPTLAAHGHEEWITVAWTGFLLGAGAVPLMVVHDRNRRRRRG